MTVSPNYRVLWLLLPFLLAPLGACSGIGSFHADTFKPYTPEVIQGNFVSREQRQALQPGMTRAQVRNILGTPLVTSVFHADRWDYTFSIRRMGVPAQKFQLTLLFKGDALASVEGDELPTEAEFVGRLISSRASAEVPPLQATEAQLSRYPAPPKVATPAAVPSPLPASYPPLESAPR